MTPTPFFPLPGYFFPSLPLVFRQFFGSGPPLGPGIPRFPGGLVRAAVASECRRCLFSLLSAASIVVLASGRVSEVFGVSVLLPCAVWFVWLGVSPASGWLAAACRRRVLPSRLALRLYSFVVCFRAPIL